MATIKKMGSLYLNGKVSEALVMHKPRVKISLADTVPGKELEWVDAGSILVAAKCACRRISWNELDRQGYIFGRVVRIDGNPYRCRSLEVGEAPDIPSEWDDLLDQFGGANELWNWDTAWFWGQETVPGSRKDRAVRGYESPGAWHSVSPSGRTAFIGFRPVLEKLPDIPVLTDVSVGSMFTVYGPNNTVVTGALADVDDYDIVLKYPSKISSNCEWIVRNKGMAIIRRKCIYWMEETKA